MDVGRHHLDRPGALPARQLCRLLRARRRWAPFMAALRPAVTSPVETAVWVAAVLIGFYAVHLAGVLRSVVAS
jgi:hypothetical protein